MTTFRNPESHLFRHARSRATIGADRSSAQHPSQNSVTPPRLIKALLASTALRDGLRLSISFRLKLNQRNTGNTKGFENFTKLFSSDEKVKEKTPRCCLLEWKGLGDAPFVVFRSHRNCIILNFEFEKNTNYPCPVFRAGVVCYFLNVLNVFKRAHQEISQIVLSCTLSYTSHPCYHCENFWDCEIWPQTKPNFLNFLLQRFAHLQRKLCCRVKDNRSARSARAESRPIPNPLGLRVIRSFDRGIATEFEPVRVKGYSNDSNAQKLHSPLRIEFSEGLYRLSQSCLTHQQDEKI